MKMMDTVWYMMMAPVTTMANANFRSSFLCSNNRKIRTTMNSATTLRAIELIPNQMNDAFTVRKSAVSSAMRLLLMSFRARRNTPNGRNA